MVHQGALPNRMSKLAIGLIPKPSCCNDLTEEVQKQLTKIGHQGAFPEQIAHMRSSPQIHAQFGQYRALLGQIDNIAPGPNQVAVINHRRAQVAN